MKKLPRFIIVIILTILCITTSESRAEQETIDCSMHTDPEGRVYYQILPAINDDDEIVQQSDVSILATYPLTSIPLLHSNPTATAKIFLDFDGSTTTGTPFNSFKNVANIITPPYSTDTDLTTFNDTELANIQKIWQRVSEDFAPFNIDITTEEPPLIAGKVAFRVAIGGSYSDWYGQSAGGVSYIGAWTWSSQTPAFIFENNLSNGKEKNVAEAISHEVGHALGLNHHAAYDSSGTKTSDYSAGYGTGETGWAPIMGIGYSKNLTTWDNGPTSVSINHLQDDLQIITGTTNGFGFRNDDYGNTNAQATPMSVSGLSRTASGIIEQISDEDVFSFITGAGDLNFVATPYTLGPNLDIYLELQDATGAQLATSEPSATLSASLSTNVSAGTYYLHIRSNGTYGRLGQYTITGTIGSAPPVGDTTPPSATISSAPGVSVTGGTTYTFTITYSDNTAVDVGDLDNNDIQVTGPNGYSQIATCLSVNTNTNGTPRIATYRIVPPGGSWTTDDTGTYTLTMRSNQVSDTSNNFVPTASLGTFSVNLSTRSITGTITANGIALSGVTVSAGGLGSKTTDLLGKYSFTGLTNGIAYNITPTKSGYQFNPSSISGTLNSDVTLNFTASVPTYTLSGTILFQGQPLNEVTVNSSALGIHTTGTDGKFSFTGIAFGTSYSISPSKVGYSFTPTVRSGTVNGNLSNLDFTSTCATGYILSNGLCLNNTLPQTPNGLTASNGTNESAVILTWQTVAGATSYQIYRSTTSGIQGNALSNPTVATSLADSTAELGVHYFYSIKAINTVGSSNISNQVEGWRELDPYQQDTDGDGVSDGQELQDGSNPNDPGSGQALLGQTVCSEWNGFLGMFNVLEHVNLASTSLSVTTVLYDRSGVAQGVIKFSIRPGAQFDVLVHGMRGFSANSFGRVCSTHSGAAGELDGRMVFYRPHSATIPSSNEMDFAFALPFQNGKTGPQFVTFNTYQPSFALQDHNNLVANWIQLTNLSSSTQSGNLIYYRMDGTISATDRITIPPGARRDFSAHKFGPSHVGMIEWRPNDSTALFQLRNVRYYYDNPGTQNSFATAFQLEANIGSGELLSAPLDTRGSSAILEIANTLNSQVSAVVKIYSTNGDLQKSLNVKLNPHASAHIITDQILIGSLGMATVQGNSTSSLIVTSMHYGRANDGSIRYIYGIQATEPLGTVLKSSYNTYLKQTCRLLLTNPTGLPSIAKISMTRSDGQVVFAESEVSIPSTGILDFDICSNDTENNYGVIVVQSTNHTLFGSILRIGENDLYRFPVPIRR